MLFYQLQKCTRLFNRHFLIYTVSYLAYNRHYYSFLSFHMLLIKLRVLQFLICAFLLYKN